MKRSFLLALIFLLCWSFCPAGHADLPKTPGRYTFMMAQERLWEAFSRGNPVFWNVRATPGAFYGYELGTLDLLQSILSKMEISGVIQSDGKETGWIDFAVLMNKERISSFSQMKREGRVGMQINSDWFSIAEDEEDRAFSMLSFDPFAWSLLSFPYDQIRPAETPFVAPLRKLGLRLWELASPWSEENNYATARSGETSHGLTYKIGTTAARSILSEWASLLSIEQFQYGLEGTDFFIGIDEDQFAQFVERLRHLSQIVELPSELVINMAFEGGGDTLSYAKGSGAIKVDGKRSDVSIRYTCDTSKKRSKYHLTIDFQPKHSDTLALDLSVSRESNNKNRASYSVKLNAHGLFDGIPYQIRYNTELANNYQLADDGLLMENITGTVGASVTYNQATVAEITIRQESKGVSMLGQRSVLVQHTYETTIRNDGGVLFSGPVTLALEIKDGPQEPPSMDGTLHIEAMDFIELESLRESIANAQETLKQNVLDVLSPVTNIVQRGAQ